MGEVVRFSVGVTYSTRRSSDHEMAVTRVVRSRTARFVTLIDNYGEVSRHGVRVTRGSETCMPEGEYAGCPVLFAGRDVVADAVPLREVYVSHGSGCTGQQVAAYLPRGWFVVGNGADGEVRGSWKVVGREYAGWTLADYIVPRLASGGFGAEVIR